MSTSWILIANYNFSSQLPKQIIKWNWSLTWLHKIIFHFAIRLFNATTLLDTALQNINLKKTIKSLYKSKIKFLIKFLYHIMVTGHTTLIVRHLILLHQQTVFSFDRHQQYHVHVNSFLTIKWFQQIFKNQILGAAKTKHSRNY